MKYIDNTHAINMKRKPLGVCVRIRTSTSIFVRSELVVMRTSGFLLCHSSIYTYDAITNKIQNKIR